MQRHVAPPRILEYDSRPSGFAGVLLVRLLLIAANAATITIWLALLAYLNGMAAVGPSGDEPPFPYHSWYNLYIFSAILLSTILAVLPRVRIAGHLVAAWLGLTIPMFAYFVAGGAFRSVLPTSPVSDAMLVVALGLLPLGLFYWLYYILYWASDGTSGSAGLGARALPTRGLVVITVTWALAVWLLWIAHWNAMIDADAWRGRAIPHALYVAWYHLYLYSAGLTAVVVAVRPPNRILGHAAAAWLLLSLPTLSYFCFGPWSPGSRERVLVLTLFGLPLMIFFVLYYELYWTGAGIRPRQPR